MQNLPEIFETAPVVYAVRDRYVIIVPVKAECLMWIRIGDEEYYDESNGILRSATVTHKIEVPMEILDREKKYTVCFRRVEERHSYFSKVGDVETFENSFRPVTGDTVRIYHIADAHNRVTAPVACASYFGDDLDLLLLNGDICENSGKEEGGLPMHYIAAGITNGQIPVIFARGNHDTRGKFAERLALHTPTDNGKSYYTVRLGKLWMLVLDCGEDKIDEHEEYGHTMCCHAFRKRQTAFLEETITHSEDEYNAPGVEYRLVMVHNPFTENPRAPFNIEVDTYTRWAQLLKEHVRPDAMLCGHTHNCYITKSGDPRDGKGVPCPVVVGARPMKDRETFLATAIICKKEAIEIRFTNEKRETEGGEDLPRAVSSLIHSAHKMQNA